MIFTVSLPANFLFFPSDIDLIVSSLLYLLLLSLFFILRVISFIIDLISEPQTSPPLQTESLCFLL